MALISAHSTLWYKYSKLGNDNVYYAAVRMAVWSFWPKETTTRLMTEDYMLQDNFGYVEMKWLEELEG